MYEHRHYFEIATTGLMGPKTTEGLNEFYSDDIDLVRRVLGDMFIPLSLDEQAYHRVGFINAKCDPCSRRYPAKEGPLFSTGNERIAPGDSKLPK
jgi:hypothetical protein